MSRRYGSAVFRRRFAANPPYRQERRVDPRAAEARRMAEAGVGVREIGRRLGVSHSTVQRWTQDTPPRAQDGAGAIAERSEVSAGGREEREGL